MRSKKHIRRQLELHEAYETARRMIHEGDVDGLRTQLSRYPHLAWWQDQADNQGCRNTLLHETSGRGLEEWPENIPLMACTLIKAGATVNRSAETPSLEPPLHQAVSVNNVGVAEVLLQAGADMEASGRFNDTIDTALGYALCYGIKKEHPNFPVNCPELLIRYGATVYLPFAAALGNLTQVKSFFNPDHSLVNRAGLASPERILHQAFLFACKLGQIEVCEYLLYRGANINTQIPFFHYKATGLHLACEYGQQKDMVAFLLENGANPNITDGFYDADAKGWAMFNGQDQVFRLLKNY